jgi:hypothetical protein
VREDRAAPRVYADREVVRDLAEHDGRQRFRGVPVGEHLVVRDEHHDLDAEILQPDPVEQGAEQVADVQRSGGAVAGEHPESARIIPDGSVDDGTAPSRCLKRG